jgi:4-hydroxy-4-methyl-2-oxoglutarate aldolase
MPEKMRFIASKALAAADPYDGCSLWLLAADRSMLGGRIDMAKTKAKGGREDRSLIRRLRQQSTDTLSDVLDVMGLANQVLKAAIRPLVPGMALAGPAFCVRGRAVDAAHPAPAGAAYEVDRHLTPGCIVVVATGGHTNSACIGGNVVVSYKARGCAGLVVDGAVRDGAEMRALRLPIFTTHVSPRRPAGRWSVVEHGVPISLPGQSDAEVVIHPGDLILGDDDGVIVIPQAIAAEVVHAAETLARLDAKVAADIRRGRDREEALRKVDRFGHIRKRVPG